MADAEPSTPAKSSPWSLPLWLTLILLVYALSPGPVIKLTSNQPPPVVEAAYAPLVFLYRNIPVVHSFYDWYFKLWDLK